MSFKCFKYSPVFVLKIKCLQQQEEKQQLKWEIGLLPSTKIASELYLEWLGESMELISRRRWTTVVAQQSNMFGSWNSCAE